MEVNSCSQMGCPALQEQVEARALSHADASPSVQLRNHAAGERLCWLHNAYSLLGSGTSKIKLGLVLSREDCMALRYLQPTMSE